MPSDVRATIAQLRRKAERTESSAERQACLSAIARLEPRARAEPPPQPFGPRFMRGLAQHFTGEKESKAVPITTIVSHAHCVDGFLSAMILRDVYPDAEVKFLRYQSEEHEKLEVRPGMIFCDMTPPIARAADFFEGGAVILDHHASAREVFELANRTEGSRYASAKGVSGAVLALEHWQGFGALHRTPQHVTASFEFLATLVRIVTLVGTYDTWFTESTLFESATCAHAALDLVMDAAPATSLDSLVGYWVTQYEPMGRLLVESARNKARRLAARAEYVTTPRGARIALLPHASHGAAVMNLTADYCEKADVVVAGLSRETPQASMRARTAGVDCGATAKLLGGGGHAGAAGFPLAHGSLDENRGLLADRIDLFFSREKEK